jgi:hypothetical protein
VNYKILFVSLFFFTVAAPARIYPQGYPQHYFRAPLDIPILLAGSFGELRTNHFHTGIDIKTCGVEGLPVYAAADGYVSRISVSATGYGNAIYVTHPNGYTTVYGHLLAFENAIQKYVHGIQYKTESFDQDFKIDPNLFQVKKGQRIAFSGNTGSSGGAHLHFEIRETKSENPVNPLLFGIKVSDTIPPVIHAIKIYPLDSNSFVKVIYLGKGKKGLVPVTALIGQNVKIEAYRDHGVFHLKNIAQIQAQGNIGFAVEANDYEDSSFNKVGIYSIELCVNEEEIYLKTMKKLDFDLKRYINTHVDYPERLKTGRWFEKSYVAPNNALQIYDILKNRGRVEMKPGNIYHVNYYLNDVNNNISELAFDITSPVTLQQLQMQPKDYDTLLSYKTSNSINKGSIYINIPAGIFYDNVPFTFAEFPKVKHSFSKCYMMGNPAIPCQDFFEIGIKADQVPDRIRDKACIVSYTSGYLGGEYDKGWIKAKTRTLGKFYISADTTAPVIAAVNIKKGKYMGWIGQARFIIHDNMSGIKSFRGTIDGHWVLFQHDAKRALVYYTFDENCRPGKHILTLSATDNKNNTRTVKMDFSN